MAELKNIPGNTEVDKNLVGLGNVDNTSDANKPVSTAQQAALNAKADASSVAGKQDTLVSGTNIKTINGQSILGSGDVAISGSGLTQQQIEGLI